MDERFITSIGVVHLHSPSMTSLCTVLDNIKPSLLSESSDPSSSFGRYKISLDQELEHSTSISSQETGDCHMKSNPGRLEGDSPPFLPSFNEQLSPAEFKLQSACADAPGQETIWSELEMCFSESDNESVMEDDRNSKEYFKVEDLGPYTNVSTCRKYDRMEGTRLREDSATQMTHVEDLSEATLKQTYTAHRTAQESVELGRAEDSKESCVADKKELSQNPSLCLNSNIPVADDSGFESLHYDHF